MGSSILQITQLGAHFCLNVFIYFYSLHVSDIQVPVIRRKLLYLCDTSICHSVRVTSGRLVGFNFGFSIQPADQTPPTQSDKYQCRIDTVTFSWWWTFGCPKHVEKINKYIYLNRIVHIVGLFVRLYRDARSTKHKKKNVDSINTYLSSADFHFCRSIHCSWKARPGLGKAMMLTVASSHLRCNLRILTTYVLFLTESSLVRLRSVWCRAKRARLQCFHRVCVGVTKRQNVVESIVKQSVFSGAIRRTTYTRVKSCRIAGSVLDDTR